MNIGGHALGDHQRFEFLIGGEQLQRTSKAVYRNAQMLGRSRRRIEVHDQAAVTAKAQGSAEIDGNGGFAHAAFLVTDRDEDAEFLLVCHIVSCHLF